ncbi:hypothetical protein Tco_0381602 [Tanacetum coccineum]
MLAPKCSTYNGRPTFANLRYLKKAQSEKPCLYEIPYDTSDPANRFTHNREETMTLANESRSKLNKDTVKPYDYTKQNSLYEIFKAPSLDYLYQLERAKEVRKTIANHDDMRLRIPSKLNPRASAQNKEANPIRHKAISALLIRKGISETRKTDPLYKDIGGFHRKVFQRIDLNADALYNEKQENLRVWLLKLLISKKPVPEWPRSSMFKRRLIAADQASVFMAMTFEQRSSSLVLHQMTSDHNRSELGIQDHSNEPSSSKLVPKVVPLAVKTATSRQELELLFHHHISMLRTTAFKMRHSMRMLVKDIRSQDGIDDKDNDKGSKSRSQSMKEQAYNKEQRERPRPHELNDKSNLIDLIKECQQ